MTISLRSAGAVCALVALLAVVGCRRHRETQYAQNLQQLVAKKKLPPEKVNTAQVPNLRWPNFSDYAPAVQAFYENRDYAVAWTQDGVPTAAAKGFIEAFQHADAKGLIPEDYDASRWASRVQALSDKSADAISLFDVAMTVNVMRFISDLHMGRVNPSHFSFDIPVQKKKYDLAKFTAENAVNASDVPKLIASVEPDSDEYRAAEAALVRYQALAKQQEDTKPLPMVKKGVSVGDSYPAIAELMARLQLEGDVAADAAVSTENPDKFDETLSAGVKHYQQRHGLDADGTLGPATIRSLNVPLSHRVAQLEDSLERWRWLPEPYLHPRLMVNLPEFVLRGYAPDHTLDFTMKVIDGQGKDDHETPVFARMMKYLIFRPYWNVPVDIAKKELVPHIEQAPDYLESKNFEVTTRRGIVRTDYTAKQVGQGSLLVRQRPGPKNSLGLVKFMFPNQYDVYMHSTPDVYLFARTRRDYSHGCVRVQKPADLAAWVLAGQGDWDIDKVEDAMNNGPDNHTVALKTQLPVVIFYLTARVDENGEVDFFDDIYKYDADLESVLAKGPPYPIKPEPIVPKTKPGDTL